MDLPISWQEGDECSRGVRPAYFGPDDDPCDTTSYLAFYDTSLFDPGLPPGLHKDGRVWGGYVSMNDVVVYVNDPNKEVAADILDSVRADD